MARRLRPSEHRHRIAQAPDSNQIGGFFLDSVLILSCTLARRLHEPLDLGFGEVLSIARFAVRLTTRRNCPINGRWDDKTQC